MGCKKNGVTKLELMNLPQIPDVIKGHVVEGKYPMDQIPGEMTTLAGTTIKAPKVVMNKGRSKKKLANFNSTNGCYHMIDEVLAKRRQRPILSFFRRARAEPEFSNSFFLART